MWYLIALAAIGSYLLGNLNGAVIGSAVVAHEDVRAHGSGNAGLTNFIRNYGVHNALLVVLIDVGKAVLACVGSSMLLASSGLALEGKVLAGVAVMLGHDFPALLGFRGGKGILSGWFIAWMIDWRVGLLIAVVFFVVYFATQLYFHPRPTEVRQLPQAAASVRIRKYRQCRGSHRRRRQN